MPQADIFCVRIYKENEENLVHDDGPLNKIKDTKLDEKRVLR